MKKCKLIDIEGTDGSGKATQTKLLYEYLLKLGYSVKLVSFPNYESKSSGAVKMYLNGELGENSELNGYQASSLYAVDRLCTMRTFNIDDYDYILFDRYTSSNMIHQSTRIEDFDELDNFLNWVEDFEYEKLGLPRPDVTIFLDMPPKFSQKLMHERKSLKNGEKKDILEEDNEHIFKAYECAKYVSERYGWEHVNCVNVIGEIKGIEKIHEEIIKILDL